MKVNKKTVTLTIEEFNNLVNLPGLKVWFARNDLKGNDTLNRPLSTLNMYTVKPDKRYCNIWLGGGLGLAILEKDEELFPGLKDLKWEDEPVEYELRFVKKP